MDKKTAFAISISGEKPARQQLIGSLVDISANTVSRFIRTNTAVVFYFRYRSDARHLLKRVAKTMGTTTESLDLLTYGGAQARIHRVS